MEKKKSLRREPKNENLTNVNNKTNLEGRKKDVFNHNINCDKVFHFFNVIIVKSILIR